LLIADGCTLVLAQAGTSIQHPAQHQAQEPEYSPH
jgi:hypothetical protein